MSRKLQYSSLEFHFHETVYLWITGDISPWNLASFAIIDYRVYGLGLLASPQNKDPSPLPDADQVHVDFSISPDA